MITKILRNTSPNEIFLINTSIAPGSSVLFEPTLWAKLLQNGEVFQLIDSGVIVVNNGTRDLSKSEATYHLYLFQEERVSVARNFSFRVIAPGAVVLVPYEQQMVGYQEIDIRLGGELDIEGEVVIIR